MTIAGFRAAGDTIAVPEQADVTIGLTINQSVDGGAQMPVDLSGFAEVMFTVQTERGKRQSPVVSFSSVDDPSRLVIVNAAQGKISVSFLPTHLVKPMEAGSYRVDLRLAGETAGKPYGVGTFIVDAT